VQGRASQELCIALKPPLATRLRRGECHRVACTPVWYPVLSVLSRWTSPGRSSYEPFLHQQPGAHVGVYANTRRLDQAVLRKGCRLIPSSPGVTHCCPV